MILEAANYDGDVASVQELYSSGVDVTGVVIDGVSMCVGFINTEQHNNMSVTCHKTHYGVD